MKPNWKGILLWSNQFYGITAALLAYDACASLLHRVPVLPTLLLIYLGTIIYYTHAYLQEINEGVYNSRSQWYQKNRKYLYLRQLICSALFIYIAFAFFNPWNLFWEASWILKTILLVSFVFSALYYIPNHLFLRRLSFRKFGIIKSISIAWVWSITCCLFPLWFEEGQFFQTILISKLFWIYFMQLFVFILILAILFDFKDQSRDKEELIKTIVVKHGATKTVKQIVYPLVIVYAAITLLLYALLHYSNTYLLLQLILIVTNVLVASQIHKIKSIHLNIIYIDGLMIIKAILSMAYYFSNIH